MNEIKPYEETFYPPVPGPFIRFLRTNIVWQFLRFIHINLKMLQMISKSHH